MIGWMSSQASKKAVEDRISVPYNVVIHLACMRVKQLRGRRIEDKGRRDAERQARARSSSCTLSEETVPIGRPNGP